MSSFLSILIRAEYKQSIRQTFVESVPIRQTLIESVPIPQMFLESLTNRYRISDKIFHRVARSSE